MSSRIVRDAWELPGRPGRFPTALPCCPPEAAGAGLRHEDQPPDPVGHAA